jgi:hypothetical protein
MTTSKLNAIPKEKEDAFQKAMADFLSNGGAVQEIKRGVSSDLAHTSYWGGPKKKAKTGSESADELELVTDDSSESTPDLIENSLNDGTGQIDDLIDVSGLVLQGDDAELDVDDTEESETEETDSE